MIIKGAAANSVDLTNVRALNVKGEAELISQTDTVTKIPTITISEADFAPPGSVIGTLVTVDSGIGKLTMDAVNAAADVNLRNVTATTYAFGNEKSVLKLHNSAAADKTFVLAAVFKSWG